MRKILLSCFAGLFFFCAGAQQRNFWSPVNESTLTRNVFQNRFKPAAYKLFQLQELSLISELRVAPSERAVSANSSGFVLSVPNAEGQLENFKVVEAPVMHPDLAAKYPGIKSYAGQGIENPSATIRFDISPEGFHAMILYPNKPSVFIDPVDRQGKHYVVFAKTDAANYRQPFECLTKEAAQQATGSASAETLRNPDDARLRTYRLALASTGEYSTYFLDGTETTDAQRKSKVLSAMNTAMTRTNGIYERDFGVRMVLVANNDLIIYLNASTDPWGTEYNTKTQQTIDAVIGSANYDIGHLVHRGSNNGNAGCIGCVCKAGSKGSAFTSHTVPVGDPFVVDYLAHEMGHQFGGNHTFAHSYEGTIAQCEPGSGSTIMGYAGITGATTDIQPHSDDYFHARTIEQITNYIKLSTGGGACAQVTLTGNTTPTANGGTDYVIPKSTPFTLTGTGSDADGDALTFIWEQIDARTSSSPTTPSATATAGPIFRSYTPTTSTSRTFPRLSSILDGTNGYKWEVLPSVARSLNFRFTVKDNRSGGANNKSDDELVTVNGTAGPFAVSAPNTAVTWSVGSTQTVTWSVNSTNVAPVNCTSVAILLSTDGGNSFTTLVASTANDGSESITVPNVTSSQCRIKVAAVGNIFFDIGNVNFTISGTAPTCAQPSGLTTSNITGNSATTSWTAVSGASSYDVDYKTSASSTWTAAATATTSTSVNLSGLAASTIYDWRVRTNCSSSSSAYATAQFTTSAATNSCVNAYEANESLSAAATVSTNTNISAAIGSTTDKDWFKFTLGSTSNLNITLSNLPADYDIILYNSAGTEIKRSENGGTTSETISNTNTAAGTYYVQLLGYNGANSTTVCYTLNIGATAVSTGCASTYDNSGNGTVSGAPQIPLNTNITGLISPSGDNDYYKFVITTGGTITITLSTLPADYDVRLYNSTGTTQVGISQNGGTTSETINYTAAAGTYYVRVYGYNNANNATSCYTLKVATGTASRNEDLIVSTSKAKVSVFPNPTSTAVNINIAGNSEKATIQVFDMYGRMVMQLVSSSENSKLNVYKLSSGVYMIKVKKGEEEISNTKFVKE